MGLIPFTRAIYFSKRTAVILGRCQNQSFEVPLGQIWRMSLSLAVHPTFLALSKSFLRSVSATFEDVALYPAHLVPEVLPGVLSAPRHSRRAGLPAGPRVLLAQRFRLRPASRWELNGLPNYRGWTKSISHHLRNPG